MELAEPQAIRTIFFDAGYTLLYPFPSLPEVCQRVCNKLGIHIHLKQIQLRMDTGADFYFLQSQADPDTWANEETITEFWTAYYMSLLRPLLEEEDEVEIHELARAIHEEFGEYTSWNMYPDVQPTLETLHKHGYSLGIISDWGVALAPILRQHKLVRYFDCLLISAMTRHAKPSPTLYELALQRANTISDFSLHIGDSYIYDVLGARATGMTPVLLDRSHKYKAQNVDCLLIHSLFD
jgi:putative hydrolase of the HAD superfamily